MREEEESFSSFYLYNEHKELFCSKPKTLFLQYKNHRINLLSGKKIEKDISYFFKDLERYKCHGEVDEPIVIHFFYELGFYCCDLLNLIDESAPLAIFCEYTEVEKRNLPKVHSFKHCDFVPLTTPSEKKYKEQFKRVYSELLEGNCYQVNLTMPTVFRLSRRLSVAEYFSALWDDPMKVSAYAHGSYIHALDQLFLSNSPECLFQINEDIISSMPIKGTVKVDSDSERTKAWDELKGSRKDRGELYMITDLIRNDLCRMTLNPAIVKSKRKPLHVPGLVHQFSVVESTLPKELSIADVIKAIFPGGSITGAPKKRVMEIIDGVEQTRRGFYCGSTLLLYKNIKTASINIRSIDVDFTANEITYGSGGGVTLESNASDEFSELLAKIKSFLHILC